MYVEVRSVYAWQNKENKLPVYVEVRSVYAWQNKENKLPVYVEVRSVNGRTGNTNFLCP